MLAARDMQAAAARYFIQAARGAARRRRSRLSARAGETSAKAPRHQARAGRAARRSDISRDAEGCSLARGPAASTIHDYIQHYRCRNWPLRIIVSTREIYRTSAIESHNASVLAAAQAYLDDSRRVSMKAAMMARAAPALRAATYIASSRTSPSLTIIAASDVGRQSRSLMKRITADLPVIQHVGLAHLIALYPCRE